MTFDSCQTSGKKSAKKESLELKSTDTTTVSKPTCNYSDENDYLKDHLFPFIYKNYETKIILKYFAEGTAIDSSKLKYPGEEYEYRIYTFRKEDSFISFQVKTKNEWFYIHECSINNDLLNFKNNIKIGMTKNQISNILKIASSNCDTIKFDLGEMSTYYDFVFKKGKLEKINIIGDE